MTTEKVSDLELIKLSDYFEPSKFRLIPADATEFPGGITEVPVSINLHPNFLKNLNFDTRNLQKFYGFAILTGKTVELNGSSYFSPKRGGKLATVELNDCGDLWIVKFTFFDETSKLYSVKCEDLIPLLNECTKPVLLDVSVL